METYDQAFDISNQDMEYYDGSGTGDQYSLQFIINTNTMFLRSPFRKRHDSEEAFNYIAINDFQNPFAVYYRKIKIHPGESIQILTTPTIAASTNNLKKLSKEKRQCKFSDEIEDLLIFK